ncbi:MAG: hypothetical protein WCJ62_10805 [Flavobacterium sp.]
MTTYKLKDDFVNGVLPNNGKPNILFKKGDVIQGEQIVKFIFNENTKGINAKPTVVGARVENADGLVFVPLQNVEIITNVSDNVVNAPALIPESGANYNFTKLAGAYNQNLIIAVVLVAGYFAYKKFKK